MTRFGTPAVRVLIVVLAGLAVTAQVAHLDSVSLQNLALGRVPNREVTPSFLVLVTADAVVSAVAALLALALAFRSDGSRGGRGLALALGSWSYLLAYAGVVRLFRPSTQGLAMALFDGHYPVVEALGLAGLVQFTAAFPRALTAADVADPETLPVGARMLQSVRIWLFRPTAPWIAAAGAVALVLGLTRFLDRPLQDAALNPAMDFVRFGAVAVVVINLRRSWVLADADARRRMLWLAVGLGLLFGSVTVLIGGNVLLAVTGWSQPGSWRPTLLHVGLVGLLWGLAMSVFYVGSLDSARVVRSVAAVAATATLALFFATGLEVLFSDALFAGISFPAGLGTAVALVSSASLYAPIRSAAGAMFDQLLGELEAPSPAA